MGVDPTGNWPDWNKFGLGLMFAGLGVLTIAAVALTGGTCVPVMALAYATLATAGTVAIGVGTSEVVESFTGENPLKEEIGEEAYDIVKFGSAAVMSMGSTIIEYGTSVSVCFVAGTPVRAENGSLPIEEIEAGMRVYAHDPETGETALKRVVRTFRNEATELVHVTVGGEEIVCTNEHPFYSPIKGWIAACDLRAGDILVTVNGEYVVVEKVQHELLESPIAVYNFEVEGFHTYYVGDAEVLVHNECTPQNPVKVNENRLKGVDVHEFKKEFVGKENIAHFDLYRDKANNSAIWLSDKVHKIWIETKYVLEELKEIFPK